MGKNIFYFKYLQEIGGTEQYLYEIAKKYGADYDIEIQYEVGAKKQLERLSKLVRCTQWHKGEIVECDKYFANFNLDQANYVKANEYYFVVHANFNELGYKPDISSIMHLNPKFIAVSKWARDEFIKFTGKPCEYCYNPLTLEPKEKVMHLVSACRLDDVVKGGKRTLQLIQALDEYCKRTGRHYIWHIFTNNVNMSIDSPNVCLMKRRIDVRPFIQDADIVLQLSNDMETYCYTTNEAWGYGVHTITTPLSVLKELPIPKQANYILEYDCSNVDDVVRHIFEDELKPFRYDPPKDDWVKLLAKGKTNYQKELKKMIKVEVINETLFVNRLNKAFKRGDVAELTKEEFDKAQGFGWVKQLQEVKTATKPEVETKKAVKKTTKK